MSWWGTLCDKVCHWLVADPWFSPGTLISSTNETDRHDITEILLKVTLHTITPNPFYTYKNDRHDITEILLKVTLRTITPNSSSTYNTDRHDITEILFEVTLNIITANSSTYKTDRHDIIEILLKVAFNTITPTLSCWAYNCNVHTIAENKWHYQINYGCGQDHVKFSG